MTGLVKISEWHRGLQRGGNAGVRGGETRRKKECLNLTNEATMLLKTNDRVYERSQTKPILSVGKPSAVTGNHGERFHSPWVFCPDQKPTTNRGEDSSWLPACHCAQILGSRSMPLRPDFLYPLSGTRVNLVMRDKRWPTWSSFLRRFWAPGYVKLKGDWASQECLSQGTSSREATRREERPSLQG